MPSLILTLGFIGIVVFLFVIVLSRFAFLTPDEEAALPDDPEPSLADLLESQPPRLTRRYHGNPKDVAGMRDVDAESLAEAGYYPASETYIPGSWGGGAWFVALLLIVFFLVGLLVIVYLLVVKPPGDLTVIYQRGEDDYPPQHAGHQAASRLRDIQQLRSEGLLTSAEFEAKRAEILRDL